MAGRLTVAILLGMCRYLVQNLDWLQDLLTEYSDDDYFIFDCPGARRSICTRCSPNIAMASLTRAHVAIYARV